MSDKKPNLDSLFAAAVELESAAERAVFLDQACAGDPELRKQVELLLKSDQQAGSFLEKPPAEFEQTMLHEGSGHNLAASLDAGFASAFDLDKSVVMGSAGHSVLKVMGQTIDIPPRRVAGSGGPGPRADHSVEVARDAKRQFGQPLPVAGRNCSRRDGSDS